jgi:hypothetical protein
VGYAGPEDLGEDLNTAGPLFYREVYFAPADCRPDTLHIAVLGEPHFPTWRTSEALPAKMKGRPVDQLVYEYMFPKPRTTDPQNFHALLQRNLILEVRQEVVSFYGHVETPEAKYPGLDYCHPTHRIRLSRWPWHRRLFRAFDGLRLTPAEIAGLTKWEGTKWAKERFEKEQGIHILDTAGDGFPDWVEPEDRPTTRSTRTALRALSLEQEDGADTGDEEMDAEDSDDEMTRSIGLALNERLRERVARRDAGDTSAVLDEEWEQWLKNALETGQLNLPADQVFWQLDEGITLPQRVFPPRMLSAARAGQWHEIPDSLHDMIRRTLELEQPNPSREGEPATEVSSSRSSTPAEAATALRRFFVDEERNRAWRRTYSDLRLPGSSGATIESLQQRAGQAPGA